MGVLWTEQARDRLAAIEDWIAQDDPAAAERHVERLIDRAAVLCEHPGMGRRLPELPDSGLRELVDGGYRIVYRQRDEVIEILTVFEGHRRLRPDELGG